MASVPLFTSGKITQNIHAAQANLSASQANETVTELDLKMLIADAYIAVLREESLLEVVQQHLASLTAHAHDVQNQFEQGIVARNDILAANVEVLNAKQAVTYTATQLDNAKARYNQLLTRPLTQPVQLAKQFPPLPKESLETLTANALKNRPELLVITQQIDSLQAQKESVKADLLPQVSANGGYNYQQNRYQAHEGLWVANVGVEWRAFDGTTSHKSDSLTRQALALQEQKETLQEQIQLQIRQAWLESQETQQRIIVAEQAISQANENSKVMNDRYQQGLATHTDVIHAEDLRTTSNQNWHQATYDLALATLHLQRALGNL
jgi:outer membrane protein TolC